MQLLRAAFAKIIECRSGRQSSDLKEPGTDRNKAQSVLSSEVTVSIYALTYPNISYIDCSNYSTVFNPCVIYYLFEALMNLFIGRAGISFTQSNT